MRAFIAVQLAEGLRETVGRAQEIMRRSGGKLRYVEPSLLHFTLVFLGEIEAGDGEVLTSELVSLAATLPPFEIGLQGAGCFPNEREPRVYWIGVREGSEELMRLQRAVSALTGGLGLATESRFKPHLTVARTPRESQGLFRWPERLRQAEFGTMRVESIALVESRLTPQGPVYTDISRAVLSGA